jgi:hypothetical protein
MIGSFFYDELETQNMSQKSQKFREFYNEIIDVSQSLPLILVNKTKILDQILANFDDIYFQSFLPKLLISLIRDCGADIYQDFLTKVFPRIKNLIDVTKIVLLQD